MVAPLISFENVSKSYRGGWRGRRLVQAVKDVSFTVEPGEVFGLLGPNRAGKTTLVKMLLSLCRPSAGQVSRFGRPLSDRGSLARIGYMHENQAFPRYLSAGSLLEYYGCLAMMEEPDVRRRVPELLDQVGLSDRRHEPIACFSKGMVQRLALAQALMNDPTLLVLDEPLEGLDLEGRRLIQRLTLDQKSRGNSVLLVSHALPEVDLLCDRVGVMVRGNLAYLGSLASLKRDAQGKERTLETALQTLYETPLS